MPHLTATVFLVKKRYYLEFKEFLISIGRGFPLSGGLQGNFYPMVDQEKSPVWTSTISHLFVSTSAVSQLKSRSPAGIMVCRAGGKLLAITFGHAWMKLKGDWIEHDFGRRVALNLIEKDDLKQIRSEQVLAKRHRSIERSPVIASLDAFGYESDRDLVFSIEGIGKHKLFNGSIRGGAAVRFDIEAKMLPTALVAITKKMGYGYQKKFPDIDNLTLVSSKSDIQALEADLQGEIAGGNSFGRITMAPPSSLEVFDKDIYFSYGRWNKTNHTKSWSLIYAEWIASLGSTVASLDTAAKETIHVVDAATGYRHSTISAKEAFSLDVTNPNGHFLIFSGKWYRASPNLELKLSHFLSNLPNASQPPPSWNGIDDERTYNLKACIASPQLLHMDARMVYYGGGQSKFEYCDFADTQNKILYFVKNPSSSAGMSHLYEQARRTSELFFGSNQNYRNALIRTMQIAYPNLNLSWLASAPRSIDWEICLVSMGKPAHLLPMFAKCGLMRVHRELAPRFKTVTYAIV